MNTHTEKPIRLVGRAAEQIELTDALDSGRPELIGMYGRRRVGKTFLIRTFFEKHLCFELTGVRDATLPQQLNNFSKTLRTLTGFKHETPSNWTDAFEELKQYLEGCLRDGARKVIFFDELPWLAGRRSGFLPAFEHFWNTWASRQSGLIVTVCGSAASWMITKILEDKGGLHNRFTRKIPLNPFTLAEVDAYLKYQGIILDHKQTIELAMAVGGVPFYLNHVRKGMSAAQNIDAMFFSKNAPLRDEFNQLFAALFDGHERHLQIIRALARRQSGLTREEIISGTKFETGGNLSTILTELEVSGIICRMTPFGRKKKDPHFRLIDELTLFHLRWVEGMRRIGRSENRWMRLRSTPAWRAWSGYAFENMCLKHSDKIESALGIAGVDTECSSWRHTSSGKGDAGAQIDLLIDRADDVISVCEIKFSETEFVIDKSYATELRSKLEVFKKQTETKKAIFLVFITIHGLKRNEYEAELVQNSVTAEALFVE